MSIAFIDLPAEHQRLKPLTFSRPSCELRIGITTIAEKWGFFLGKNQGYLTLPYLHPIFAPPTTSFDFVINGTILPDRELLGAIQALQPGHKLLKDKVFIGARMEESKTDFFQYQPVEYAQHVDQIEHTWNLFQWNGKWIRADYERLCRKFTSEKIADKHTIVYGDHLFISAHATVKAASINTETGPVYIGAHAEIQEGSMLRGPVAIGDHAVVNMGAKIRGDTTIGPYCKVGGEISNSILMGYSNKGHDGFLGNSVVGEWCNLGADTNNSNLKNNYGLVKMWDYSQNSMTDTGLQFCGLVMGDHSRCGINTMFNTGTTIGFGANIFGAGYPPTHIPSFAWGGAEGIGTYQLDKFAKTAEIVMERRNKLITKSDIAIFKSIFEDTVQDRNRQD